MTVAPEDGPTLDTGPLPAELGGRITWVDELRHNTGNAASAGIWRVTGPAGTVVYKLAQPPAGEPGGPPSRQTSDDPAHWNYWRREFLAYTDGLAAGAYAGTGIEAPRLLGSDQRPDGRLGLWLELVPGTPAAEWPVDRFKSFAAQLGAGQARWAGQVPERPWLSRRWLRQYLAARPAPRELDWDHPTARIWPEPVRRRLAELYDRRQQLLVVAEATEQTLCHLDIWPENLFAEGAETVLLDWSFVGGGGLGEDPANLMFDTFADGLVAAELLPEVVDGVVEGYLAGLRDGGWTGSPDDVRRTIAVCGAVKYAWFAPALVSQVTRGRPVGSVDYGRHESTEQMFRGLTGLMTLVADWTDTAFAASGRT